MSGERPLRNEDTRLGRRGRGGFVVGFLDHVAELFGIDGAVVNVLESHPAFGDAVDFDDVANEIGGSLLPEWFLASAEELVHQRSDGVRQRVGIHPVSVEGVPLPVAVEADLEVVAATLVFPKHVADGVAEVALDFEDETGRLAVGVVGLPREELLGEGLHAGGGLAGPHGSDDGHAGEEPFFRKHQPVGLL